MLVEAEPGRCRDRLTRHESKAERVGLNESSAAFEGQLRCGEHHDASAWNPGRGVPVSAAVADSLSALACELVGEFGSGADPKLAVDP